MRSIKFRVIIALIIIMALTVAVASAATIKVTSTMNIRRGPGEKYSVVGRVSSGTILKVSKAKSTDGTLWFKITSGKYKGRYISSQHSTTKHSKIDIYVRTTGTVKFRTRPTQYSTLLKQFGSGKTLHCTGYRNGWFRIRYNGKTGYVYGYRLVPA